MDTGQTLGGAYRQQSSTGKLTADLE